MYMITTYDYVLLGYAPIIIGLRPYALFGGSYTSPYGLLCVMPLCYYILSQHVSYQTTIEVYYV
jgi:hypothetical protein